MFDELEKLFAISTDAQVNGIVFVTDLVLAGTLAYGLQRIYRYYGSSISNRAAFSDNFAIITMTTMLVITVVKSSLALSLGLIGALSIVRFRAAIKEPEELTFLFLAIAIGLGFGAGLKVITLVTVTVVLTFLMIRNYARGDEHAVQQIEPSAFLTVSFSTNAAHITADSVVSAISLNLQKCVLKRFDTSTSTQDYMFAIELDTLDQIELIKTRLKALDPDVSINIIETV